MRKVEILSPEREKIQEEVKILEQAKQEISEMGRIANEQGSETFGHDNPILENKKEQSELLYWRILAKWDILSQIQNCLIIPEEDILHRKQNPNYRGLGSIFSLQMNGARKELQVILTGLIQGKIEFEGKTYTGISPKTDLFIALQGKSKDDNFERLTADGRKISGKILDIQ